MGPRKRGYGAIDSWGRTGAEKKPRQPGGTSGARKGDDRTGAVRPRTVFLALLAYACSSPTEPRLVVPEGYACQAWVAGGTMCCTIHANGNGTCTFYPNVEAP